jgi:hypothetical protein
MLRDQNPFFSNSDRYFYSENNNASQVYRVYLSEICVLIATSVRRENYSTGVTRFHDNEDADESFQLSNFY